MKKFLEGFKSFGENVTAIINFVVLTFVYFIAVGLTALVARLVRKHFLSMSKSEEKTYWTDLNLSTRPEEEYYRQF